MEIEKRAIFPIIMFIAAGASFAFGIWQHISARQIQASSAERMAHIMTTIERSSVTSSKKQELYTSIMGELPASPTLFTLNISGSFASQAKPDRCTNDGQRAVCRALQQYATQADFLAICGPCIPQ